MRSHDWTDGLDHYKQHCITIDDQGAVRYRCVLEDRDPVESVTLTDHIDRVLSHYDFGCVELLYSGGLDSELLLVALTKLGKKVKALTMRLNYRGYPLNITDLYYSEKFLREHAVDHRFIDLDLQDFYGNGKFVDYLEDLLISEPHVASHMWLMTQCHDFPVLAGEYTWPWAHESLLSPHRLEYNSYDRFLKKQGISGIGNFWNHDYNLNRYLITQHRHSQSVNHQPTDWANIPLFKSQFYQNLVDEKFETRCRSYGWDTATKLLFDKTRYKTELLSRYPAVSQHEIQWQSGLAAVIESGTVRSNDRFW